MTPEDYANVFPNFWFNPSIEPKLLAQFSSFLFYPQVKINFELRMDYADAFSQFLVHSKHRNPNCCAELLSGFQILSYLFNPSIKPKIACAIFGLFIFKRLSKQVLNALKTKKTRHFRAGFFACDPKGREI